MPMPLPFLFSEHRPQEGAGTVACWIFSPVSSSLSLHCRHSSLLQCSQRNMPLPLPFAKQRSQDPSPCKPRWRHLCLCPPPFHCTALYCVAMTAAYNGLAPRLLCTGGAPAIVATLANYDPASSIVIAAVALDHAEESPAKHKHCESFMA